LNQKRPQRALFFEKMIGYQGNADLIVGQSRSVWKNRDEKRDPEMRQSKKGKNGFFGMKAHIGVDAESGLTHTLVTPAGNVPDVTQTHNLLHGDETMVFGDA
jgi:transposase, IS5 family